MDQHEIAEDVCSSYAFGTSLYGMSNECKAFADGGGFGHGNACVIGAIENTLRIAATGIATWKLYLTVKTSVQVYYGTLVPDKRASLDLADIMTAHLGAEVRHVGSWGGSKLFPSRKREEFERLPVFSTNLGGQDLHFTVYHTEENETTFRVGCGLGEHASHKRQDPGTGDDGGVEGDFSNPVYFEHGGLEAKMQLSPDLNSEDVYLKDQADWDWLKLQTECYVTSLPEILAQNAVLFDLWNDGEGVYMASGAIAPLLPDDQEGSILDYVDIQPGIPELPRCANLVGSKDDGGIGN